MRLAAAVRMIGGRWLQVTVAGAALAVAAAAPSVALAAGPHERVTGAVRAYHRAVQGTPSEVINAQTDPQAAGDALNAGCADLSNCSWKPDGPPTIAYGPSQILGDALYNCSTGEEYAETAVSISTEREETTSISETLSVEVGLGFLGFEKSTAEFEAFSKQSDTFGTKVTIKNAVAVPAGWKGWTNTNVLTAYVSGSAYVTEGIKLIEVKNMDLSFPGYRDPNDTTDLPVVYAGYRTPMTTTGPNNDVATYCDPINGLSRVRSAPAPPASFTLTFCQRPVSFTATVRPAGLAAACASRKVTGSRPPATVGQAAATLTRGGRTYASGTDTGGHIRLIRRRPIKAGKYTLTIRQNKGLSRHGLRHLAQTFLTTVVPITIR